MDVQEKDSLLSVNEGLGYPIFVGANLRREFARLARARGFIVLPDERSVVVAHAHALTDGISGRRAFLPIALGEGRKRLATVERIMEQLLANGADRHTLIVGVGGGVAADLFGFVSATFMRGAPYAHVATSLVAMADAAVGGKTGVDLRTGKNIVGVFNDPQAVFCPTQMLQTLPFRHIREGLAEIVKHGVIAGNGLFEALENLAPHPFAKWPWPAVVAASIGVKATVVAGDPTERGAREVLNLGHTFAHGIERASGFRISHGAAVAIGLRGAGLLALHCGRYSAAEHLQLLALLTLLRLPMRMPLRPDRVFDAMHADKKRRDGRLRFVLPNAIGAVEPGIAVADAGVRMVLDRLARPPAAPEFP